MPDNGGSEYFVADFVEKVPNQGAAKTDFFQQNRPLRYFPRRSNSVAFVKGFGCRPDE